MSFQTISRALILAAATVLGACAIQPAQGPQGGPQPGQLQAASIPGECRVEGMKPIRVASSADCDTVREAMKVITPSSKPVEEASASGCGVKLAGQLIKELPAKAGTTCKSRRDAFYAKFMAQCNGKTGTTAGDIACGRKIDI
jgi:hypothetical protein